MRFRLFLSLCLGGSRCSIMLFNNPVKTKLTEFIFLERGASKFQLTLFLKIFRNINSKCKHIKMPEDHTNEP